MGNGPLDDPRLSDAELDLAASPPEGSLDSTEPPYRDTERADDSAAADADLVPPRAEGIPRAPLVPRFSPWGLAAVPLERPSAEPPPAVVEDVRAVEAAGTLPGFPAVTTDPPEWSGDRETPDIPRPPSIGHAPRTSAREIQSALDAGEPESALDLADRAAETTDPEIAVLRGQALFALGARERALAVLAPALSADTMNAEVRTRLAQLLVELSEPELAVTHARAALSAAPDAFAARVTCAWALIRLSRRTGDESLAREADALLAPSESIPPSARVISLRAAALAEHGPATRSVSLAQEALEQDPTEVDALAAVALASKRLGLDDEALRALSRLESIDPKEASVTASALEGKREPKRAAAAPPSVRPPPAPVSVEAIVETFGEAEGALFDGDDSLARRALESACASLWASLPRTEQTPWPKLARGAAPRFTILPVLRHFAPYDCSVFSVERLVAAIDLVYGRTRRPPREPVVLVLGSYLGECLRQAYGGEWNGGRFDPGAATVIATGLSVAPCERVALRIARAEPLVFQPPARLHPGADPFGNSVPLSIGPPSPWDPEPWPSPERFREIGRLISGSVIGLYCRNVLHRELDLSPASLTALDRYVALVAPERAPPDPSAPWVRRGALLVGAYVAELLTHTLGARLRNVPRAEGPESYQLELRDGTTALPVARVLDRLAGRRMAPLTDYVARLAEGRALSSYPAPAS